jgi:hypothetical protein
MLDRHDHIISRFLWPKEINGNMCARFSKGNRYSFTNSGASASYQSDLVM